MGPQPEGRGELDPWHQSYRLASQSFNGATARRPWRTRRSVSRSSSDAVQLQWGHSPKAVENVSDWRWLGVRSHELQWGHSPKAVENYSRPGSIIQEYTSFNGATARRPWRTSTPIAMYLRAPLELQWGHSPKAVENAADTQLSGTARYLLQWGHSPKAVENAYSGVTAATARYCFNGATARRPWRTFVRDQPRQMRANRLQWGHSPKAVENLSTVHAAATPATGCFNGATARRPWRTEILTGTGGKHFDELQWGHSPKAVENRNAERLAIPTTLRASMGPQPEGRGEPIWRRVAILAR